jgi:acetyl-CoA carboxylase carboxyl transferase beta subunit
LTAACSVETDHAGRKARARELWSRCSGCGLVLERVRLDERRGVCEHCGHHHPLGLAQRIASLFDPHSYSPRNEVLRSADPLGFGDGEYARAYRSLGREAMVYGTASIDGAPCVAVLMDFSVFGGSLGVVVGEIFCRACELSLEQRQPLLAVISSGGARMQEGTPALLQMAKVMVALNGLEEEGRGYVTLLCDPTCGGVTASFATAADVILAEPGALICFSGPRVVEQTTGVRPRPDFSRAESLYRHGLVDLVVAREGQRQVLGGLLRFLAGEPSGKDEETNGIIVNSQPDVERLR